MLLLGFIFPCLYPYRNHNFSAYFALNSSVAVTTMIEFNLTIYMCSYCTRVHNAAHECLQHELIEHPPTVQCPPPAAVTSPPTPIADDQIPDSDIAEPIVVLKRDHKDGDREEDTASEPQRKSVKIEQEENLSPVPVESPELNEAVGFNKPALPLAMFNHPSTGSAVDEPIVELKRDDAPDDQEHVAIDTVGGSMPQVATQSVNEPKYRCKLCLLDFNEVSCVLVYCIS